jgi:ferrous iron transport protein A
MNMLTITDLIQGDRVKLADFGQTDSLYRRKLLSLGLTPGTELAVKRVAPLGCPVQVELRGTLLALRKDEACHLRWVRV